MGEIGGDVSVEDDELVIAQCFGEDGLGCVSIAGEQKRGKLGMNLIHFAEFAVQVFRDDLSERVLAVLRERDVGGGDSGLGGALLEEPGLGSLSGTIDAFENQ